MKTTWPRRLPRRTRLTAAIAVALASATSASASVASASASSASPARGDSTRGQAHRERLPVITSAATMTGRAQVRLILQLTAEGNPVPHFSMRGRLPTGVSFKPGRPGTATISGIPPRRAAGAYDVVLTASNTAGSTNQALLLLIDGPPVFTSPGTASGKVGRGFTFAVTTSGWPHPTLDYTGTLMSGLTVVVSGNGNATISGAPAGTGRSRIVFAAANRFGQSVQVLSIRITS